MADKISSGVRAGSTSVSIDFVLRATADNLEVTGKVAADMVAYYWRQGGSPTSITLSDLAAINSAYSSGGVKQADSTNMPGTYRLDLPDAAIATGADWVEVNVKVSGAYVFKERFALTTDQVQSGDSFARLGAPVGASISADIAGVQSDTDNIQTRIPAALVGGKMDSNVSAVDGSALTAHAAGKLPADVLNVNGTLQTAGDLAAMITAVDDYVDTEIAAIKAKTDNLPVAIKKNVALNNFPFFMVDSSDHITPKTGLAVTAQRSIDGGAFAACTNSAVEVGFGVYKINLSATDLNGDTITLKFTGTGADQRTLVVVTQT